MRLRQSPLHRPVMSLVGIRFILYLAFDQENCIQPVPGVYFGWLLEPVPEIGIDIRYRFELSLRSDRVASVPANAVFSSPMNRDAVNATSARLHASRYLRSIAAAWPCLPWARRLCINPNNAHPFSRWWFRSCQ
jgi:hypothetical protein